MLSKTENLIDIGTGIYTVPDISFILNLPADKVRRWLREYWNNRFSLESNNFFSEGRGRYLTTNFHTLIEFFTFYQLRELGVSTLRIVKAHQILSEIFETKYPFAKSNILTDGKQVLFEGAVGEIIQADSTLRITIREIFEPFCRKVDFNSQHLAERFYPLGKDHAVIVDPKRQFGQPLIGQTNILTETIYNLSRGGESVETIRKLYNLSIQDVKDAILFHHQAA